MTSQHLKQMERFLAKNSVMHPLPPPRHLSGVDASGAVTIQVGFPKREEALTTMREVQPFVAPATKGCHSQSEGNGESDGDKRAGVGYGWPC